MTIYTILIVSNPEDKIIYYGGGTSDETVAFAESIVKGFGAAVKLNPLQLAVLKGGTVPIGSQILEGKLADKKTKFRLLFNGLEGDKDEQPNDN